MSFSMSPLVVFVASARDTYVKIPPGEGCGFVQFVQRHAAEMAINQMQHTGNSRVRLGWGRSQNNSGPAGTPYRPAPPPPVFGPGMGMPPQHPSYGGGFAPMKVRSSNRSDVALARPTNAAKCSVLFPSSCGTTLWTPPHQQHPTRCDSTNSAAH